MRTGIHFGHKHVWQSLLFFPLFIISLSILLLLRGGRVKKIGVEKAGGEG